MRILLIRPPIYSTSLDYPSGPRFGIPVSLLYLASVLEKEGIDVTIYDALIDFDWRNIDRNKEGNYHIGASWNVFTKKVLEYKPDIAGITNPFSDFADYAVRAASEIKRGNKNIITVIGGPHATGAPESFHTKGSGVDYVVRGEGERTFVSLLRALQNKASLDQVTGITYRVDSKVISTPPAPFIGNLDELPLPAYHLIEMERYFDIVKAGFPSRNTFKYRGSEREVSIITSRGCPFQCVFCGNHLHMGRRWRYHSVEYILDHIALLITRYNVKHFHIEDDNLSLNKERFEQLLEGIIKRKWDITWDTPNGIRADKLTKGILKKMKEAGCTYLVIGIESGNQKVLDEVINKGLHLQEIIETVSASKEIGLDVHAFYMIGFPGEGKKEIHETLDFALHLLKKYIVIPHLSLTRPLPGTELYKLCEEKGYLTEPVVPEESLDYKSEIFKRTMIQTGEFNPADLENWSSVFYKKVIRTIVLKTVVWLLYHPHVLIIVLKDLGQNRDRGVVKNIRDVFFNRLFFKNNFLDGRFKGKY